ncbi:hypothetical protein NXH76_25965 [Blautia schinkii]|nr:hypothetical protein [Blautia schinkii]
MNIFEYNEEEELKKLRTAERRGGYEEGHKEGCDEGILLARIEDIFDLLQDYGEIPGNLREKISSQRDKAVLAKWHKLAAHVDSIEDFAHRID